MNGKTKFYLFWSGQQISLFGSGVVGFALMWWLTSTTGSVEILAKSFFFSVIPSVILGPFIGTWVDRWNRQAIMRMCDSIIMVLTLFLAYEFYTGSQEVWMLYVFWFIRSVCDTFHRTALSSSISLLVSKNELVGVSGVRSIIAGAQNALQPVIGAALLELVSMEFLLCVDSFLALFAIVPLCIISLPQPSKVHKKVTFFEDLRLGFTYAKNVKGLIGWYLTATSMNFFYLPFQVLKMIIVYEYFAMGAIELSWLSVSYGVGMILGGYILKRLRNIQSKVLWNTILKSVFGVCFIAMGYCIGVSLWGMIILFGISALAISIGGGLAGVVMQTIIPNEMQGRQFALLGACVQIGTPMSILLVPFGVELIGVKYLIILCGAGMTVTGIVALFFPALRNLDTIPKDT